MEEGKEEREVGREGREEGIILLIPRLCSCNEIPDQTYMYIQCPCT